MSDQEIKTHLMAVVADAASFCYHVENCLEMEMEEFVVKVTNILPRLYLDFATISEEDIVEDNGYSISTNYVDEEYYNTVRENLARLIGEHDTYLETFEEDMKYSDTPIAVTISESLADIFQPLYDFVYNVKESNGENLEGTYKECNENFHEYWSQTLCNVMRPLNELRMRN